MDVLKAIEGRRSIRKYSARPVEEEKLNKVLEAARLAPSARNRQEWKFIVVKDDQKRAGLAEAAMGQTLLEEAPVAIVCCGTDPESVMVCGQRRHTVDLSIAASFMILEAHEQGLGTCWLGRFDESKVKKLLGIPDEIRVVTMTPLGYPDESPAKRHRKELSEIVCYDGYY